MENVGDSRSTINKETAAFDSEPETTLAESTILVKVIAINAFYHARVLDMDLRPFRSTLNQSELDTRLRQGTPDLVDAIWKFQGTRREYFSFATKFLQLA